MEMGSVGIQFATRGTLNRARFDQLKNM